MCTIVIIVSLMVFTFILLTPQFTPKNIGEIYIETIDDSGHIERISVDDKQDKAIILKAIEEDKNIETFDFCSALGGYRIVLDGKYREVKLYPYCGELSVVKVGRKSLFYYSWDDNKSVYDVINKYINVETHKGIYVW